MSKYQKLPTERSLEKTVNALTSNGFEVFVTEDGNEARDIAMKIIPDGARVMENTSKTLDATGIRGEIKRSTRLTSVHSELLAMDRSKKGVGTRQKELRSVSDVAIGSVHAVTEDGHLMLASGSGSQVPGYAYGADRVIFVVGTHKIVPDVPAGFRRISKHSHPLEDARMKEAGYDGSHIRRILIMNSEPSPRTSIIFVKQPLGF